MSMSFATSARVFLGVGGLWGALFAPSWVPILCIVLLSLRWSAPECVLLGFLVDMLWLPTMMPGALPLFTIASIIIVWGLEPLRHEFLR
jgi:hypothetical protein